MNGDDEIRQLVLEARDLRVGALNALSEAMQSLELLRRARREREAVKLNWGYSGDDRSD
jgi:hypothetical protein